MARLVKIAALSIWLMLISSTSQGDVTEVDVELVLMVDVSRSMTANELEIQRRGYAEALKSPEVIRAMTTGLIGRVAITYVEWSGPFSQRVIVDWTLVDSREDAAKVADKLTAEFNSALRRTSISGAIDFGVKALEENAFVANRRVIDVSGDGPNNQGRPVVEARNQAVSQGIVINGLPLMTKEGMGSTFQLEDLDVYYRKCVIGGPGAFVVPVRSWDEFPAAVRQKLVWELAGRNTLPIMRADFHVGLGRGNDCLIGEKIWERIRQQWIEE